MSERDYGPSPQICKYQTSKKLLEFTNKLVVAEVDNYANIHSPGGGGAIPSRIGLTLLDYSSGTGPASVSLTANISPSEVAYLQMIVEKSPQSFTFVQQKIIAAKKGNDGRAPVTKLEITRTEKARDGSERRLKWFVRITNGSAVPAESATGGVQAKSGTFKKEKEAFINLSDEDFFKMLHEVNSFIRLWEMANAIPVLRTAQQKLEERYQRAM